MGLTITEVRRFRERRDSMATTAKDVGRYLEQRLREHGRDALITYGELVAAFDDLPALTGAWAAHPLCDIFGDLDDDDAALNRPYRTAIVVSQRNGIPGPGFFKMYAKYHPNTSVASDIERITIHQQVLRDLAAHYGHA
jgi:hypothetical protein